MLRSKMDRKIAVFYFPRDHELRVLSSPNSDNPGRRAWPFLTLPTLVYHSLHKHSRWEKESVYFPGKKEEYILFSQFSYRIIKKSHLFHAIFPESASNMQQSTVKEGGRRMLGKEAQTTMGLSPTNQTMNLKQCESGKRLCWPKTNWARLSNPYLTSW